MENDLWKDWGDLVCSLKRKLGWGVLTKWQLGVLLALLQVQVHQDPHESVFGVWTQTMVVKAPSRYTERFAKGFGWFGSLVVEKTWLRCPYDVTFRGVTSAHVGILYNLRHYMYTCAILVIDDVAVLNMRTWLLLLSLLWIYKDEYVHVAVLLIQHVIGKWSCC